MSDTLIYLASPYSHPDAAVKQARFEAVCRYAASMMRDGLLVFSPIADGHAIASVAALPTDWTYWAKFDTVMIGRCDELHVMTIDGWRESVGVAAEIAIAKGLQKPIVYSDHEALRKLAEVERGSE